jgi:hypothetical protein
MINVVCGPMGHAGLRVTPFQNRENATRYSTTTLMATPQQQNPLF